MLIGRSIGERANYCSSFGYYSTDDDIIDPQLLDSSELPIISPDIPTLSEALSHLDNLTTFFQSMSISTLVFSYYFSNFRFTSYCESSTGEAKTSPTH